MGLVLPRPEGYKQRMATPTFSEWLRTEPGSRMFHVLLTVLAAGAVAQLTQERTALAMFLMTGWAASIFMFAGGALKPWRIVAAVASQVILYLLIVRVLLPS